MKERNLAKEPISLDEQSGESSDEQSEASDEDIEPRKLASNEESNDEDEAAEAKIVGATGSARKIGRPKKQIRNPYGRKEKPKEAVELNFTQVEEPTSLSEALSSPQRIVGNPRFSKRLRTWND